MKRLVTTLAGAGLLALSGAAVAAHHGAHGAGDTFGWERFAERHDLDGDGAVTREELAQSSELFARLDADGDGRVVEAELQAAHAGRAIAHFARWADADEDGTVSASEWKAFLTARDSDGDGVLDLHRRHRRGGDEEGSSQRGSVLDANGNGALEVSDLQTLYSRFDADRDGALAADELPVLPDGPHGHFRGGHRRHLGGPEHLLGRLDTDDDGSVSRAEWDAFQSPHADVERHVERHAERFAELDANGDGSLSREELATAHPRGRRR